MQMLAMIQAGQQAEKRLRQRAEDDKSRLQLEYDKLNFAKEKAGKPGDPKPEDFQTERMIWLKEREQLVLDPEANAQRIQAGDRRAAAYQARYDAINGIITESPIVDPTGQGGAAVDPNAVDPNAGGMPTGSKMPITLGANNVINEAPPPTATGIIGNKLGGAAQAIGQVPARMGGALQRADQGLGSMLSGGHPPAHIGGTQSPFNLQASSPIPPQMAQLLMAQESQPQVASQGAPPMTPEMIQKLAAIQQLMQQQNDPNRPRFGPAMYTP